jgi:hypothetical protein
MSEAVEAAIGDWLGKNQSRSRSSLLPKSAPMNSRAARRAIRTHSLQYDTGAMVPLRSVKLID